MVLRILDAQTLKRYFNLLIPKEIDFVIQKNYQDQDLDNHKNK
jgi:hypothetical protein